MRTAPLRSLDISGKLSPVSLTAPCIYFTTLAVYLFAIGSFGGIVGNHQC